jgi:hypothetical protein
MSGMSDGFVRKGEFVRKVVPCASDAAGCYCRVNLRNLLLPH